MIMNKKNYLGMALLAVMLTAVSCGSDEDEIDPAVKNFVESTTFTDEELTGFEPLGIQGEWEMPTYYVIEGGIGGIGGTATEKSATLFFNNQGKVRVLASDDDAFFKPTGVYDYSFNPKESMLTIDGTLFHANIQYGYLNIHYPYDSQQYGRGLKRKATNQTAVADFFDFYLKDRYFAMADSIVEGQHYSLNVVNSQEELQKLYSGDMKLPDIDFNRYTLLMGYIFFPSRGTYPSSFELTEKDGQYTYDIRLVTNLQDMNTCDAWTYYYWRLYPKLSSKEVKVVFTESTLDN